MRGWTELEHGFSFRLASFCKRSTSTRTIFLFDVKLGRDLLPGEKRPSLPKTQCFTAKPSQDLTYRGSSCTAFFTEVLQWLKTFLGRLGRCLGPEVLPVHESGSLAMFRGVFKTLHCQACSTLFGLAG